MSSPRHVIYTLANNHSFIHSIIQIPFPAFWASKLDLIKICGKSASFSHQNKKKMHTSYKMYSSTYHFEQQIILKQQHNNRKNVYL
jgi:hypothetical protein